MEAIQSYLGELRVFHTYADNLLTVHRKIHEKAKISRNAVQVLDSFNQEKYNDLDRSGRASDIKKLPITPIELFKDGDMCWNFMQCSRIEPFDTRFINLFIGKIMLIFQ